MIGFTCNYSLTVLCCAAHHHQPVCLCDLSDTESLRTGRETFLPAVNININTFIKYIRPSSPRLFGLLYLSLDWNNI